MAKRKI